jgi:hypothetical protein
LRDELLVGEVFKTLIEAKELIEQQRRECNHFGPNDPLVINHWFLKLNPLTLTYIVVSFMEA